MVRSGYLKCITPGPATTQIGNSLHSMINVISAASLYYCRDAFSIYGVSFAGKGHHRQERTYSATLLYTRFPFTRLSPSLAHLSLFNPELLRPGGKSLHAVSRFLSIIPPSNPNRDANCKE